MMKTRIPLLLGLVIALTPASVVAQSASPVPAVVDTALVEQLCAAAASDETVLAECIVAVETALTQIPAAGPGEEPDLGDRARSIMDDARELLDDTVAEARELDVQEAIDEAVAALADLELDEIDLRVAIDEAVAEALAAVEDIDLAAAVDEALAEARAAIDEADFEGALGEALAALEESVEEARAVVASAEQWAQENEELVCSGGSFSLGTTAGLAVFALTGWEWLGLRAYSVTERITDSVCDDIIE